MRFIFYTFLVTYFVSLSISPPLSPHFIFLVSGRAGEVVDAGEVSKLCGEVNALRVAKLDLEKTSGSVTIENNASTDIIFSLLIKNPS